ALSRRRGQPTQRRKGARADAWQRLEKEDREKGYFRIRSDHSRRDPARGPAAPTRQRRAVRPTVNAPPNHSPVTSGYPAPVSSGDFHPPVSDGRYHAPSTGR